MDELESRACRLWAARQRAESAAEAQPRGTRGRVEAMAAYDAADRAWRGFWARLDDVVRDRIAGRG